jgi:AcrR family transcriptional regulator
MRKAAIARNVREDILDATDLLLARYGYKKMTIEDVAREANIGKGTIYLYFPSKEELVLSHIDRIVARLKERLQAIADQSEPAALKLKQMLILRVMYRFDAVQHYSQSLSDLLAALRSGLLARRREHFAQEVVLLVDVLTTGKAAGELFFQDASTTAYTLLLATNSLLPYSLSSQELGSREDIVRQVTHIAELLLCGLTNPQALDSNRLAEKSAQEIVIL